MEIKRQDLKKIIMKKTKFNFFLKLMDEKVINILRFLLSLIKEFRKYFTKMDYIKNYFFLINYF